MNLKPPELGHMQSIASQYSMDMSQTELGMFLNAVTGSLESYKRIEALSAGTKSPAIDRDQGFQPTQAENIYNAWAWKTSIKQSAAGKLHGKKVVLKDNISLAGVPMMNGASLLEGVIPDTDAEVVTRVLEEGGEVSGKAVCEFLCFSGGSHTASTGPVRNPVDPTRTTGGSSSGCAALVAAGEVDMAIAADQGGSIRVPSSWCGIYGFKPSFGLVPYTGMFQMERTLDTAGVMGRTVADIALLLEVIAGEDGVDERQRAVRKKTYTQCLSVERSPLRIGIVKEGFGWSGLSEQDVDRLVMDSAYMFEQCGAGVEEVSIPMHRDGIHIWSVISTEGAVDLMIRGKGEGTNARGHYQVGLMEHFANALQSRANELSDTVKFAIFTGEYMKRQYDGKYYAIAQNLARQLKRSYDEALAKYDILVMPTLPVKAKTLPSTGINAEQSIAASYGTVENTASFSVIGYPALSVPCGLSDGLPVGMMLVGRYMEDDTVLRAAYAFEQLKQKQQETALNTY